MPLVWHGDAIKVIEGPPEQSAAVFSWTMLLGQRKHNWDSKFLCTIMPTSVIRKQETPSGVWKFLPYGVVSMAIAPCRCPNCPNAKRLL